MILEIKYFFYFLFFIVILFLSINVFLRYTHTSEKRVSCLEFEKILEECKKGVINTEYVFLIESCKNYIPGNYKVIYTNGECIVTR